MWRDGFCWSDDSSPTPRRPPTDAEPAHFNTAKAAARGRGLSLVREADRWGVSAEGRPVADYLPGCRQLLPVGGDPVPVVGWRPALDWCQARAYGLVHPLGVTHRADQPPLGLLTEDEAAAYVRDRTGLRFTRHMVKRQRLLGRVVGHRLNRRTVYKPADLDAFLAGVG